MTRVACVYVPHIFLQHVLRSHPDWRQRPVVVVADARPTASIVALNRAAHKLQLREGMGLQAAQSIVHDIEVAEFDGAVLRACIDALWRALLTLTPGVEPDPVHQGTLWLDPSGLDCLFQSLSLWGQAVRQAVLDVGFEAHVVIGFNRYLTLALARTHRGVQVLKDASAEIQLAYPVGLGHLGLSPALDDATQLLGMHTLGDLLRCDASTVRQRLGAEAQMIYRMAKGHRVVPLKPKMPEVPCAAVQALEPAELDSNRLLFAIKALLDPMLQQLVDRGEQMVTLHLNFELERHPDVSMVLTPAQPCCDSVLWMDLIRLRLNACALPAAVTSVRALADTAAAQTPQMMLLNPGESSPPKRDVAQAEHVLARLVAALGSQAVTRAQLQPSHLPEKQFAWQPCTSVALPRLMGHIAHLPLVRRVLETPQKLPSKKMTSLHVCGPHKLSQRWWHTRVVRDYFYVETQDGRILWLFRDGTKKSWYVHGYAD